MADQKVSDLPSLSGADVDPADLLYIIDSSAGSAGSKKITVGQYQLAPVTGGTANTVVYLNGSKVESSSAALTFDGTNFATTGTASAAKLIPTGGTATGNGMYLPAANTLGFSTNGAETMRLDASGNLGLGVTPSAWDSVYKAMQNGQSAFMSRSGGSDCYILSNNYYDGTNFRYINTAAAAYYRQDSGAHAWFTAPSGTAGNPISFSQVMSLQANGVLALGAATPALNVGSSAVSTGDCSIEIGPGRSGNGNAYIDLTGDTTYTDYGLRIIRNNGGPNTASSIVHRGTGDLQLTCSEAAAITFGTSGAERARITSAGDFIVGSSIVSGSGAITMASVTNGLTLVNNNDAAATGYVFSSFRRSSTEIGSITQNGTTAVLFNTTSDRRLKDNVVPAPSASDVIDAIEIVSYDWKSAPDEHVTYGVIAQDLALVAPQAVLQGDDGDEIKKTWGVDYSKLVPMLIKEIQSLRARVAALESA